MSKFEYRLAGSGGQGLILAGIILAEAAGVHEGAYVVQTQSYGPESRGGASRAEVIVSDQTIDYPKVTRPDVVLCLTAEACRRYAGDVASGGLVVVDEEVGKALPSLEESVKVIRLPFLRTAREELGREIVANIVALGAIVGLTDRVSPEAVEKALLGRVPKGTTELNQRAFAHGLQMARGGDCCESAPVT